MNEIPAVKEKTRLKTGTEMDLKCQASNCKAHPDWRIIVTTEGFQVYYLCSKHMDNRVYPSGETVNTFTLVAVRLRVS
jgi:hypothetical protein